MFNIYQTPSMFPSTVHVPVLLRCSHIWSTFKRRLFLPLEHMEAQCYSVFGDATTNISAAPVLGELSAAEVRSLAGNGMHSACIGACLMYILACSVEVDNLSAAPS